LINPSPTRTGEPSSAFFMRWQNTGAKALNCKLAVPSPRAVFFCVRQA
jgi:hypothetical protein